MDVHLLGEAHFPLKVDIQKLQSFWVVLRDASDPEDVRYMELDVTYESGQKVSTRDPDDFSSIQNLSYDAISTIWIYSRKAQVRFYCNYASYSRPCGTYQIDGREAPSHELKRRLDSLFEECRNDIGWLHRVVVPPKVWGTVSGLVAFLVWMVLVPLVVLMAATWWKRQRVPAIFPLISFICLAALIAYVSRGSVRPKLAVPVEVLIGFGVDRAKSRTANAAIVRPLAVIVAALVGIAVVLISLYVPGLHR
jgi:hypothetical protein